MRGLAKCRGELKLMTLCYNFKRMLTAVNVPTFIAYCQARMVGSRGSCVMISGVVCIVRVFRSKKA